MHERNDPAPDPASTTRRATVMLYVFCASACRADLRAVVQWSDELSRVVLTITSSECNLTDTLTFDNQVEETP